MASSRAGRPKSQIKRDAILHAAVKLFLEQGYKQTSMEEVAKHSGVSKQTIYSHYESKDALFCAGIAAKCDEHMIKIEQLANHDASLEAALRHIATRFLALFHDEDVISMYSTVIAEARNTPHVAKIFYQAGPLASIDALSALLFNLCSDTLSKQNARLLAIDFYTLVKSDLHTKSLMNLDFRLNAQQCEDHVNAVVKKTLCLKRYFYEER
jgi:TetR/AcrR family transcriptional repressor of mexJK operon